MPALKRSYDFKSMKRDKQSLKKALRARQREKQKELKDKEPQTEQSTF